MHVGQSIVATCVAEGQPLVIETQQVQDRLRVFGSIIDSTHREVETLDSARMSISGRTNRVGAPKEIVELVNRFREQYDSYRLPSYGETQLRREFIDPFFKALGWDIDNEQGNAEAYKDVVHEDSIKIGVATKAPDYSFRIGGARKFFVEAKKPSVNVGQDVSLAFQLRSTLYPHKD